jgi:nicotinic acid phosphoribosyltransferase
MPLIQSMLDTDLYKFTMMQVVYHQFSGAQVAYRYKCRNPGVDLRPFATEIGREVEALAELRFQPEELDYLAGLRFIKPDFVDFLDRFRFNPKYVDLAGLTNPDRDFVCGPWVQTILFEIPLLALNHRDLLPQHAAGAGLQRGRTAPAGEDRSGRRRAGGLQGVRVRHPPAGLPRLAGTGSRAPEGRHARPPLRNQQRGSRAPL